MPIELKNVTRVYKSNVEVRALDDVSLSVAPGEWLAVMGPSGSGKSTLVNLMGCLDQPTSGEIWIYGSNISKMTPAELNRFRAEKIGFKVREAQLEKVPYMLVVGEKEQGAGTVSVRARSEGDIGAMPLEEFVQRLEREVHNKALHS